MRNVLGSLAVGLVLGLYNPLVASSAEGNATQATKAITKTIIVSGSQMTNGKWQSSVITLRQGQKYTIVASPMDTLNKSEQYKRDAVVFRMGQTGAEYLTDSNARQTWYDQYQRKWQTAPQRSFKADLDGELFYSTRQSKKFSIKITVE